MKNIFITGAASGIGRAVAELFHQRGWSVGLTDSNEPQLAKLARRLGSKRVWHRPLDVTDAQACAQALDAFAEAHNGHIQVLFNSAGLLQIGAFTDITLARHRQLIDVNVQGVINMAYQAFEHLRVTPGATMITMSSASALYGVPTFASYSSSKFAVKGLTEALNIEWQQHDIAVVDVMPSFVQTAMLAGNEKTSVVSRMGVKLSPQQVAEEVWAACDSERPGVHRPVGWQFRLAMLANKLLPVRVTREAIRLMSR